MLGLGNSVGTPPEGITAEAVVVRSFDELDALGEKVRGKIVLYNVPFTNYGETVRYRGAGASRAATLRRGRRARPLGHARRASRRRTPARSATTTRSRRSRPPPSPSRAPRCCSACRSAASASCLRLKMEAKFLPDAESANVVAELKGRERPDEIVLVGGHFDSWDVGQGAHDDGGGCIVAWEAVRLLKKLNLRPRRTIRVVLFTNEENGAARRQRLPRRAQGGGGEARPRHRVRLGRLPPHRLRPRRGRTAAGARRPREIASSSPASAPTASAPTAAAPTSARSCARASPARRLNVDGSHYFDIHHTHADTVDKVDPQDLAACVAAMAVMAYVVADMPARL